MEDKNYKSNIINFKIFVALTSVLFYLPIFVIFYNDRGLVYSEITTLKIILFITVLLLEVPSGVFSDTIGIKLSIVFSVFLYCVSFVITAFSTEFYLFAISSVIFGAAMALMSGCPTALLFNYLKEINHSEIYTRVAGSVHFIQQLANAFCLFMGSFIFILDSRLPYLLSALAFLFSLVFLFRVKVRGNKARTEPEFKKYILNYIKVFKRGSALLTHARILFILLISAFFLSSTIASFDIYQVAFQKLGVPTKIFGPIYCGLLIIAAIGSKYAYLMEDRFKDKISLLNCIVIIQAISIGLVYLVQSHIILLLALCCIHELAFGCIVVFIAHLNRNVHDDKLRVTINSYSSLFTSLSKSLLYFVTGYFVVSHGYGFTFFIVACILAATLVILNLTLRKKMYRDTSVLDNNDMQHAKTQ